MSAGGKRHSEGVESLPHLEPSKASDEAGDLFNIAEPKVALGPPGSLREQFSPTSGTICSQDLGFDLRRFKVPLTLLWGCRKPVERSVREFAGEADATVPFPGVV